MPFEKGKEKTGGRPPGGMNKFTTLKQAFLDAFLDERIGGTEGIVKVFSASDIKRADFFKLISKMLPSNVDVGGTIDINQKVSIEDMKKARKAYKRKCKPNG